MANEIIIKRQTDRVPKEFVEVKPGIAFVTKFIKANAKNVYLLKRTDRRGFTRIVSYFAPPQVVADAMKQYRSHRRKRAASARAEDRRRLLGDAAAESARIFLSLDEKSRKGIIDAYRGEFGEKKAEYARRAYAAWRDGRVAMSSQLQERLLSFLPPLLSIDGKYKIVEVLWNSTRQRQAVRFSLTARGQIPWVVATVQGRLKENREGHLPGQVRDAVRWLAADDAQLAMQLLHRFGVEEDTLVAEIVQDRLATLEAFVRRQGPGSDATHEITIPGLVITVQWRHSRDMANDDPSKALSSASSGDGPLQGANQPPARIENPGDLLGEALKRLSPERTQEILNTAATAALNLQIKQKESELDRQIAGSKLDQVAENARRHAAQDVSFDIEAEHRSQQGFTRVKISKRRGFLRWLFG